MRIMKLALFLVVVVAGACRLAEPAPHSNPAKVAVLRFRSAELPTAYTYRCSANVDFVIKAAGNDAVDLFLPNTIRRLLRQPIASGVKFSDGEISVWNKGAESVFEIRERSYPCRNERASSIRPDARLRGVQFRAAGAKGEWLLEVAENGISFTDDEDGHVIVPAAIAERTDGATVYVSTSEAHRLQIVVEERECMNVINGERSETTVQVNLDGYGYSGCGYVR